MAHYAGFCLHSRKLLWTAEGPVGKLPNVVIVPLDYPLEGTNYKIERADNKIGYTIVEVKPTEEELIQQGTTAQQAALRTVNVKISTLSDMIEFKVIEDNEDVQSDLRALRLRRAQLAGLKEPKVEDVEAVETPTLIGKYNF